MKKQPPSVAEAQKKLKSILKEAKKQGLSPLQLAGFSGGKKLLEKATKQTDKKPNTYRNFAVFAALFLVAFVFTTDIYTHQGFANFWFKWKRISPKDQLCTIPLSDNLVSYFRPPVDCSMCKDVTEVEKVANLSPEDFEERYAYTGRPVVITDGMTNWTAQHVFSFDFFKEIYMPRMGKWRLYKCHFFPYNTDFQQLSDVFNMSDERALLNQGAEPWYVGWANCDDEINQILRRHYERPYFLPPTAETKKLDWIFMGSEGFGAPMHVDNVEHPSWQAQLRGKKKWTLQPPPECYYSCQEIEVVVEAGEIIVLDTNRWYHSTLIVSKEMSITIGAEYD